MSEILNDYFLLSVNNRISVAILVLVMLSILLLIFILTIVKKQKSK